MSIHYWLIFNFIEPLRSLVKVDKVRTFLLTTHEYGSSALGSQH